jgi:hypothetical protein
MTVKTCRRALVAFAALVLMAGAAPPGAAEASTTATCSFHTENGQLTEASTAGWHYNGLTLVIEHTGPVSFSGSALCSANGGVPQQSALRYSASYLSEEWQLDPTICPSLTFTGTIWLDLPDGTRSSGMNVYINGPHGEIDIGPGWGQGNMALIPTSTTSGLCPKTFAATGEFNAVLFP